MPTLRDICKAFAPESLERYPHLPTSPRQGISAIQQCQSGHNRSASLSATAVGGSTASIIPVATATVPGASSMRTGRGSSHDLDKQLPGPHFLRTFTVSETLPPLDPLPSTPRLPGHVQRLVASPYTARHRRACHRDGSAGFSRGPAYLGPATPIPPAYPLHRSRWRSLQRL